MLFIKASCLTDDVIDVKLQFLSVNINITYKTTLDLGVLNLYEVTSTQSKF